MKTIHALFAIGAISMLVSVGVLADARPRPTRERQRPDRQQIERQRPQRPEYRRPERPAPEASSQKRYRVSNHLERMADANHDGYVTAEEFHRFKESVIQDPTRYPTIFRHFDVDDDGFLSPTEKDKMVASLTRREAKYRQ